MMFACLAAQEAHEQREKKEEEKNLNVVARVIYGFRRRQLLANQF